MSLPPPREVAVEIAGVNHHFGKGEARKQVLFDNSLVIRRGEIVIMTGPSGSGKTTLLTLIGTLRGLQEGSIRINGQELAGLAPAAQVQMRRNIGFIFQAHNLLNALTARQNVRMAIELTGVPRAQYDQIANDMDSGCFIRGSTLTCGGQIVDGAWRSLAGGANHRCGLQTDGSIWCWGLEDGNVLGQGVLASGSTLDAPTRVGTDNDWIDVGTGARLSCGMKADRSIWCWGDPQLTGTNTVDSLGVPLRIPGDNWAWLEVAWNRACAGTADKHLWCWGSDGYGLEVVPGIDPVLVPTDLGGTFDEVLLGGHHTCARIGSAWSCWGWNAGGQLVNGNVETHQYPGVPLCGR